MMLFTLSSLVLYSLFEGRVSFPTKSFYSQKERMSGVETAPEYHWKPLVPAHREFHRGEDPLAKLEKKPSWEKCKG